MGQSRKMYQSRSTSSLDVAYDEAELKRINLRLTPTCPSHSCCAGRSCVDSVFSVGPYQSEDSDSDQLSESTVSSAFSTSSELWSLCEEDFKKEHALSQPPSSTVISRRPSVEKTEGVSSVTVTRNMQTVPGSVLSATSLSVTCQGRMNNKSWSFSIDNVHEGLSREELSAVIDSIQSAIATPAPVSGTAVTHNDIMRQSKADSCPTNRAQVTSRDCDIRTVLPVDFDTSLLPPPYKSPERQQPRNSVMSSEPLTRACDADRCNPDSAFLLSSPPNTAEQTPALWLSSSTNLREPEPTPHTSQENTRERRRKDDSTKQILCSVCKQEVYAKSRTRRSKDGQKPRTKGREALTLHNVDQDVVESYLTYKFRDVATEQLDSKSLTFSEYMTDKKPAKRSRRRASSPRRTRET